MLDCDWETYGITTVDVLNDKAFRTFVSDDKKQFAIFNKYVKDNYPSTEALLTALEEHREDTIRRFPSLEKDIFKAYQQHLLDSDYSPSKIAMASDEQTRRMMLKENYTNTDKFDAKDKNGGTAGKEALESTVKFRYATAVSCKNGVEFGQVDGNKVLFELGSSYEASDHFFDANAATVRHADDGRLTTDRTNTLRSITNVELRKAFRHDLSDDSLQFFKDGKKTHAPWDKAGGLVDQAKWTAYAKERIDKHEANGNLSNQVANTLSDVLSGDHGREQFRAVNQTIEISKKAPHAPDAPHAQLYRKIHSELEHKHCDAIQSSGQRELVAAAMTVQALKCGITKFALVSSTKDNGVLFLRDLASHPDNPTYASVDIGECLKNGRMDGFLRDMHTLSDKVSQPKITLNAQIQQPSNPFIR